MPQLFFRHQYQVETEAEHPYPNIWKLCMGTNVGKKIQHQFQKHMWLPSVWEIKYQAVQVHSVHRSVLASRPPARQIGG